MVLIAFLIPVVATVLFGAIIKGEGHYYVTIRWLGLEKKLFLWEESYIGGFYGLAAGILIWWPLCPFLAIISGFLWAMGGAEGTSKSWRRWLIGAILAIFGLFWSRWALLVVLTHRFATGEGYGIPCPGDEGSLIGRFWWNRTHSEFWANVLTRLTVGLLYAAALIPLRICHK